MSKELLTREEIPVELTWDLSLLFPNEEALFQAVDSIKQLADSIEKKYKGKLTDAKTINSCVDDYTRLNELITTVSNYTSLDVSVDYGNTHKRNLDKKISVLLIDVMSRLTFVRSEITEQNTNIIEEAIAAGEKNNGYLKEILRDKPHALHPEAERVLAALGNTIGAPYEIYEVSKLADMKFDNFNVNGVEYPLGYSLFEDDYEYDQRTEVRRTAFAAFSNKLRDYENLTATAYNTRVQYEKAEAGLRGFDSVFDSLLFGQKVSLELYNRQIDLIMEKLAPHMRKYAKLLQKIHGLDKMTYADLKITVDPDFVPPVTIAEAKDYVVKGLAILGEDNVAMVKEALDKRWIDFAQNQGKSTGGFCASPYGYNSYILLSWNDRMSDVFTLAHELGHAGHFRRCNQAQSIWDTEVSSYFVEAPSTMNEMLMSNYLLKTNSDKRFRRWVLSNMISNTYYHNFVTHLLEAAYQREVYKLVDAGESVQAEDLNRIMRETLEKFWGDAVEITEGAELTWMRQPHYYMGLYSYTYSAGLTIATEVSKRIEKEGQPAVDDWIKTLTAGSTLTPEELAKLAGVDISTDAPLLDTIETIGAIIDEICTLTDELM